MKASWIQGLDEGLSKEIKGDFKSSLLVRNRLKKLIEDKMAEADRLSLGKEGYEVANWAYKQADVVGYKRALQEIISLIIEDK